MTWFTGREYDIADLDYEDQNSLLEAMEWKRYLKPDSKPLHDDARLDAWVSVRCKQCRDIISSNTDTDGVVRLDHKYTSEEELYAVCVDLRQDMVLFKDWMARRRELEKLLPKRVRKTYSEMTERIIQNRLSFGQELGEW